MSSAVLDFEANSMSWAFPNKVVSSTCASSKDERSSSYENFGCSDGKSAAVKRVERAGPRHQNAWPIRMDICRSERYVKVHARRFLSIFSSGVCVPLNELSSSLRAYAKRTARPIMDHDAPSPLLSFWVSKIDVPCHSPSMSKPSTHPTDCACLAPNIRSKMSCRMYSHIKLWK